MAVIIFAIAYALKGGWLGKVTRFDTWRKKQTWFISKGLDGKSLATILVFVFCLLNAGFLMAVAITAAWLLAVSPSMGEEAGAIGRYGHWWGKYRGIGLSRSYGVKKGLQRGVWIGAMFSVVMGSASLFIPVLGIGFVAAHFIFQEIYYRIHKQDSWAYAEPAIGALIGFCIDRALGA